MDIPLPLAFLENLDQLEQTEVKTASLQFPHLLLHLQEITDINHVRHRFFIFFLDLQVHFFPVDRDMPRRFDAELDGFAFHGIDGDFDLVVDDDRFAFFASEYEHPLHLPCFSLE